MDHFPSPDTFDPKLLSFLEQASEALCLWLSNSSQKSPRPVLQKLPEVPPRLNGLSPNELLEDLQLLMESSFYPSHPGSLAHLDPPPLSASIVGDLICAGLNNNLLAEELSPSLTKLERCFTKWIALEIGMSQNAGGVLASGGSLSNLMGLLLGRNNSNLLFDSRAVVLASSDAHVSLSRAIRIMGLPPDSLIELSTDQDGQIDLASLEKEYSCLKANGQKCFAVVATAGTTVRGSVDPLIEIARFCKSEDLWLHIDAAIGGVFALSKSTSSIINGISLADSITLNPQKVIGITKTSSLLLVANQSDLDSCFSADFPYIEPTNHLENNGGELGIQGSRSGEILKLWLGFRQLGETGICSLLENSIHRRQYLQSRIDPEKFDVLSGPLHLIAICPKVLDSATSKEWSITAKNHLLKNHFMLSRPFHNNRYYLKAVLGNPHTEESHLDELSNLLNHSF